MSRANNAPISWLELYVPSPELASNFYGDLFGWTSAQMPGQVGCDLISDRGGNKPFASLIQSDPGALGAPCWYLYFAVDDIDSSCERIQSAGGTIIEEPFEIEGVGRFALAADPDGSRFFLHGGEGVDARTGNDAPCMWFEIVSDDVHGTHEFYSKVFGWEVSTSDLPGSEEYRMFQVNELPFAGISDRRLMGETAPPPQWLIYFASEDIDKDADRVKQLGGKVCLEPFDIEAIGRMASVMDSAGAIFWLYKPESMV